MIHNKRRQTMKIPFVTFKPMETELDKELRAAFDRVYTRSWYICWTAILFDTDTGILFGGLVWKGQNSFYETEEKLSNSKYYSILLCYKPESF